MYETEIQKQYDYPLSGTATGFVADCREEAIAGWDKYREKTVYGLMGEPSYEAPTLVWVCSMDDEIMEGKVITEYADLYS